MQSRRIALGFAVAILFAVAAQPGFAQNADASIDAIHDEIRALKDGAEEAFNAIGRSGKDGDIESILQYVHDDIVLVAMNGDTARRRRPALSLAGQSCEYPGCFRTTHAGWGRNDNDENTRSGSL